MFHALRRRRVRAALAAVAVLGISGAAVAYFSTSGSGSGSAQVGTSSALTITGTITPGSGGIVPGGNPATVAFSVNNTGSQAYVNTISLNSVTAYSDSGHTNNITGTGTGKCDTTAFTMSPVSEGQSVGSGTTSLPTSGSLVFADNGVSQDGCKNAYLVASFTSN